MNIGHIISTKKKFNLIGKGNFRTRNLDVELKIKRFDDSEDRGFRLRGE